MISDSFRALGVALGPVEAGAEVELVVGAGLRARLMELGKLVKWRRLGLEDLASL